MSPEPAHHPLPAWTVAGPLAAAAVVGAVLSGLAPAGNLVLLVACAVLLAVAVFSAVHHAEVIALKVGEPFGSIVLAVSITVIEVALIVSLMLAAPDGAPALARDTVYATIMIVLNGMVGGCIVLGGWRHREQSFRLSGATAALSVLVVLAALALVLPNFTRAAAGPVYATPQLIVVGLVSLTLYGVFLFVQVHRHRDYFVHGDDYGHEPPPSNMIASAALALLVIALVGVVLLAKSLSSKIDSAVDALGLPAAFVGVVIAFLVLLPEGTAALRAAARNRLQVSLNLALGSALASIGMTVPVVGAYAILAGVPLQLGIAPAEMTLLALSLLIATVTLATGRTTILQGAVHLAVFAVFLLIAAVP